MHAVRVLPRELLNTHMGAQGLSVQMLTASHLEAHHKRAAAGRRHSACAADHRRLDQHLADAHVGSLGNGRDESGHEVVVELRQRHVCNVDGDVNALGVAACIAWRAPASQKRGGVARLARGEWWAHGAPRGACPGAIVASQTGADRRVLRASSSADCA